MDNKNSKFVHYVYAMVHEKKDKAFAAKLKRADNDTTEYQSWEILARWIDLNHERERKAYGLIGASIARSKKPTDGELNIGKALLQVFKEQGGLGDLEKSSAAVRLRRLLACKDTLELVAVLRSVIRLLESRGIHLSYSQLLDDILRFQFDSSRDWVRTRWAQDFFDYSREDA